MAEVSNHRDPRSLLRSPSLPQALKYRPGQIDLDQTTVLENLAGMPVDDLPTIGLTYWYLLANLQRVANQCLLATTVLQLVMGRFFGIGAELVLTVEVPNGRGGTTRYGNESPHLDGQHFVGHVGLITNTGLLIDPTAGQFPRDSRWGYRPLVGRIGAAQVGPALDGGAMAMVRLQGGGVVTYRSTRVWTLAATSRTPPPRAFDIDGGQQLVDAWPSPGGDQQPVAVQLAARIEQVGTATRLSPARAPAEL